MTVTLINRVARLRVFLLPHAEYCLVRGACACVPVPGTRVRRVPSALTLPASATVEGLDTTVLLVAEIARAVRSGDLGVVRASAPP